MARRRNTHHQFNYNRAPEEIILACQAPGYQLYDLGPCGDVSRNAALLELFEGLETIGINRITPRFVEVKLKYGISDEFEARRAGEVLRWGTDRGILERIVDRGQPAWRILHREMHYLAVGPAKQQRAIRIRGLKDAEASREAAKLEAREMGRRQRAHEKVVAHNRKQMQWHLDRLMRLAPYASLPETMNRFRIEGCDLLRNYRGLIVDAAGDADADTIIDALEKLGRDASWSVHQAAVAMRKAAAEAIVVTDDDADAIGDLEF